MVRKLPIGIQGFEKLRTVHFLYVDKTRYIYQLAHNNVPYFLSRPRRFGKSLLLSTMKAYWEGKKELFSGLEIEKLEEGNPDAWRSYPVFYFTKNRAGNLYWVCSWHKKNAAACPSESIPEQDIILHIQMRQRTSLLKWRTNPAPSSRLPAAPAPLSSTSSAYCSQALQVQVW